MGKFNYTNRKSEGVKLSDIVAKDLRKKSTQFFAKKDHGTGSSLELMLPGKNLTDDAIQQLAPGLEDALTARDGAACYRLEELDLSNNCLTTRSLLLLAGSIRLASYDLRKLDLSGNSIRVHTDEEAHEWEAFLESFRNCRVLRLLDVSNNDLSGQGAFEIFARVYFKHPVVDPAEPDDSMLESSITGLDNKASGSDLDLTRKQILKRRCGLRAIPYIDFSDCLMTDSGALQLSYVLAQHYFPQQLICQLKTVSAAIMADEKDHASHCWGLIYVPNRSLTDQGAKLLALAEEARKELAESLVTPDQASDKSWLMVDAKQSSPAQRRRSSGLNTHKRQSSTVSTESRRETGTSEGKKSWSSDLERFRKKIQRNAIEERQTPSLWTSALKMLVFARTVLLNKSNSPEDQNEMSDATENMSSLRVRGPVDQVSQTLNNNDSTSSLACSDTAGSTYTNGNNSPRLTFQEKTDRLLSKIRPDTVELYNRFDRDTDNIGNLSNEVWRHIVACAADAEGILSEEQQRQVVQWAGDREDLGTEKELSGKGRSVQIWNVLKNMGCLAYDMKV